MGVVEVLDPVVPTRTGGCKVDVSRGERNGRVSSEWFNRPDDERYLSLDDLWANVKERSERSWVVQSADTQVEAARDNPERRLFMGSGLNDPKGRNGPRTTSRTRGRLVMSVGSAAVVLDAGSAPRAVFSIIGQHRSTIFVRLRVD